MRHLIRAFLVALLLIVVAFFAFGWWSGAKVQRVADRPGETPAATSGSIDRSSARERDAQLGEKAAVAASQVTESIAEAAVTAKVKAKMALDDLVKARAIDVSTGGNTVTLSGTVSSAAERERAVRLARETDGVTRVVDELRVER